MVVGTFLNSPLSPHPVLLRSYLSPIFIHPSYLKKLCRKIQSFMLRDKESERNSHKKKTFHRSLGLFLMNNLTVLANFFKSWENYLGIRTDKIPLRVRSLTLLFNLDQWVQNSNDRENVTRLWYFLLASFWKINTQWIWPFTAYSS